MPVVNDKKNVQQEHYYCPQHCATMSKRWGAKLVLAGISFQLSITIAATSVAS